MKNLFKFLTISFVFSLAFNSCTNEDSLLNIEESTKHTFEINASLASLNEEDETTRSSITSNVIVEWTKDAAISVINLSTKKVLGGNLVAQKAGTNTTFVGTVTGSISAGDKLAFIYPAKNIAAEKTLESSDFVYDLFGSQTTTTPFVAKYTYTVPDNSKNITLSNADFTFLSAYLKMNLSTLPSGKAVTKVTIENMGTSLSCMPNADGSDLTATGTLGDINIDLSATTKEQGYTVVKFSSAPIAKQAQDRTVSVTCDGSDYVSSMVSNEIKSNAYVNVNVSAFEKKIPYVTFRADAAQTLTLSKAVETLEYSVDGGEWAELSTNSVTFGGENGDLQLRGKSSIGTAKSSWAGEHSSISFGNNTKVQCSGDIRTLVDYENFNIVDCNNARFTSLFNDCQQLTTAPELPATTLASECYSYMFCGCKALTTAPELPATTLASECYNSMFDGCWSLTTAPKLPATTLATECYLWMFADCRLLTTAPELPATTLASDCYSYMFAGCGALTTAPELLATTLATRCYKLMFEGCKNLNYVKMMAEAYDVKEFGTLWLWNEAAPTGTFVKNVNATWNESEVIPSGWTVLTANQ